MRREDILGDVRRLDETEEGLASLMALSIASSPVSCLAPSSLSRLRRLLTSSSESYTVASAASMCTSWLSALALRLETAARPAEGDVSTASEAFGFASFWSASSVSNSGSMVMALAASGLLWKGAVEASP